MSDGQTAQSIYFAKNYGKIGFSYMKCSILAVGQSKDGVMLG